MIVVLGSEQLSAAINDGCEFDPGGTHKQHSPKWPGNVIQ